MRKSKSVVYSLSLFLAILLIISLAARAADASSKKEANSPGKYLRILKSPDQQTILRGDFASFTIVVLNNSDQVNLTDVVVQDLFTPDCNRNIGNLPADSNFPPYKCTLIDVQESVVNWITVEGTNPVDGEVDFATDTADVDIMDISVMVDAVPSEIQSPGGEIEFSVNISNTGSVTATLNSLTSVPFGNLIDPANQLITDNSCVEILNISMLLPDSEEECFFKGEILGEMGQVPVEVTAGAEGGGEISISKMGVTYINISDPVVHRAHFPLVVDMLDEPNDTCLSAFPLSINQPYYFLPDDRDDWYLFDLIQEGEVLVELSNFIPQLGQIIIYDGGQCNSLQVLKNNGNDKETKLVPLGNQPPGRYHILVINDGDANVKERYQLKVKFQQN